KGEFGSFYNSVSEGIIGKNKTQQILDEIYKGVKKVGIADLKQIPFNSRDKFSLVSAVVDGERKTLVFGAFSSLKKYIGEKALNEVEKYIDSQEQKGFRVILAILTNHNLDNSIDQMKIVDSFSSNKIVVFAIEDSLNPG